MLLVPLYVRGRGDTEWLANLLKDTTASKWQNWDLNPGSWAPEPALPCSMLVESLQGMGGC